MINIKLQCFDSKLSWRKIGIFFRLFHSFFRQLRANRVSCKKRPSKTQFYYLRRCQPPPNSSSLLGAQVYREKLGIRFRLHQFLSKLFKSDNFKMGRSVSNQSYTLDLVVWLITVKTLAIDFLTVPILASFEAAPFVTFATRSCRNTIISHKYKRYYFKLQMKVRGENLPIA